MIKMHKELQSLLLQAGIKLDDYFDIDYLLKYPELLDAVATYIASAVLSSQAKDFDVLVCGDKIKGPFGILPLGVAVSLKIKKPLLVWKEIAIGLHKFFPTDVLSYQQTTNNRALIFHDVSDMGNTASKITMDLEKAGFVLYKIISLVDTGNQKVDGFVKLRDQGKVQSLLRKGEDGK
jgi:orotate phosphoribosyltransferase